MIDRIRREYTVDDLPDSTLLAHAAKFLKPGGRLVAIMSSGITYRSTSKVAAFRTFVRTLHGTIDHLPAGAFKSSGTDVNTVLVAFNVP